MYCLLSRDFRTSPACAVRMKVGLVALVGAVGISSVPRRLGVRIRSVFGDAIS